MYETTDGIPSPLIPINPMEETETSKYDDLVTELNTTNEQLLAEKKLSNDLNHQLQLKAVSIDCQMIETESLLDTSYAQNEDLSKQIELLKKENESTLQKLAFLTEEKEFTSLNNTSLKRENESLLQRTATLARRDQIQKASIMTSEDAIVKLMTVVEDFQSRFESLASGLQGHNENGKNSEQRWKAEKDILNGCIEKLKSDNNGMKIKFIQTLTKHQSAWQSERDLLQNQIIELESEKKKAYETGESFKKEITEFLASSSVGTSNTFESTDTSTSSTNDATTDTPSTNNGVATVTSSSTSGEIADTSSTNNDKSLSQLTHEQLRNDLNNAERKFDKVNAHKGRASSTNDDESLSQLTHEQLRSDLNNVGRKFDKVNAHIGRTPTTNDESPSQITQEQLRNDLNNVERKFNEVNAHKARLLFLTKSLIPSSAEEGENLNSVDTRDAICNTNVSNSNNGAMLIDIEDKREQKTK
jgi:hypothetical protein